MGKYDSYTDHIRRKWTELTFSLAKNRGVQIALPNSFVSPSPPEGIFDHDQFYWDSYFIIIGLLEQGFVDFARGMVDNLAYLCDRFGLVPMRNRMYNLGISQPPLFSSMVRLVFEKTRDIHWLSKMVETARIELSYWNDNQKKHTIFNGLARYCDHWHLHSTAEHESGWDMTSRFNNQCLNILPVDLNSLLFKSESDVAFMYETIGNHDLADHFKNKANARKAAIQEHLWNDDLNFFFDFNWKQESSSIFYSLASFYPLWAGIATEDQARKAVDKLSLFEYDGGLANTQDNGLSEEFNQWDYPNGWPNQQLIVIEGLLRYGFEEDAKRLAEKWLDMNAKVFDETQKFWEKYDVVDLRKGKDGRYPTQHGFGWTNGVFVKLVSLFNF
ncbi:MAG: trehalase family glycosidase [Nanobdellota archaeon]